MRWRGGLGGGRCCIDRRETAPESGFARCHRGRSGGDRKSTRLNSSHQIISYAVFCLKKKKTQLQSPHDVVYRLLLDRTITFSEHLQRHVADAKAVDPAGQMSVESLHARERCLLELAV